MKKYDSNHVLNINSISELSPEQLEAFDEWWKLLSADENNEHVLAILIQVPFKKAEIKQSFKEIIRLQFPDDISQNLMQESDQRDFLHDAMDKCSQFSFSSYGNDRDRECSFLGDENYYAVVLKALRTLTPAADS